jgi:hypothetical protein
LVHQASDPNQAISTACSKFSVTDMPGGGCLSATRRGDFQLLLCRLYLSSSANHTTSVHLRLNWWAVHMRGWWPGLFSQGKCHLFQGSKRRVSGTGIFPAIEAEQCFGGLSSFNSTRNSPQAVSIQLCVCTFMSESDLGLVLPLLAL